MTVNKLYIIAIARNLPERERIFSLSLSFGVFILFYVWIYVKDIHLPQLRSSTNPAKQCIVYNMKFHGIAAADATKLNGPCEQIPFGIRWAQRKTKGKNINK